MIAQPITLTIEDDIMTALELLDIARKGRPEVFYTINNAGTAVAARHSADEPWHTVAGKTIDGRWMELPGDLLINGKPVNKQEDWRADV